MQNQIKSDSAEMGSPRIPGLARVVGLADGADPDRACHVREWALAMLEQAGYTREIAQLLLQRMLRR